MAEVSADMINGLIADAEAAAINVTGSDLDLANKRIADTKILLGVL